MSSLSRRKFIKQSALSSAAFTIVPRFVLGGKGYVPPSDTLYIAGIGVGGNIETCGFEDWKRCFAVNVDSIFHGCQKALPLMREHAPGSIVNISSIAGLIASDTMPAYNASKAAVWMLTKSIALHCAKNNMGIRCNSVHPTFVDTPILDGTARNHNLDILRRYIDDESVDRAEVVMLLSNDAKLRVVEGVDVRGRNVPQA